MIFLIHYDRHAGKMVSLQEFGDKDMDGASAAKLALEISLLDSSNGHEVVLLEASSIEDLKSTHRRYFESLQQMRISSRGASKSAGAEKPSGQVIIREATIDDVNAVEWLQKQLLPDYHKFNYAQNIGVPGCANLVALVDGGVVGFISVLLVVSDPTADQLWCRLAPYVGFVGVLQKFQRKGFCRMLLNKIFDQLSAEGRESVLYLECTPDKSSVYEKIGFERIDGDFVQKNWGLKPKACVMRFSRA